MKIIGGISAATGTFVKQLNGSLLMLLRLHKKFNYSFAVHECHWLLITNLKKKSIIKMDTEGILFVNPQKNLKRPAPMNYEFTHQSSRHIYLMGGWWTSAWFPLRPILPHDNTRRALLCLCKQLLLFLVAAVLITAGARTLLLHRKVKVKRDKEGIWNVCRSISTTNTFFFFPCPPHFHLIFPRRRCQFNTYPHLLYSKLV